MAGACILAASSPPSYVRKKRVILVCSIVVLGEMHLWYCEAQCHMKVMGLSYRTLDGVVVLTLWQVAVRTNINSRGRNFSQSLMKSTDMSKVAAAKDTV